MKTLIFAFFLTSAATCLAGDDLYVSKMKETLQAMDQCQTVENYQKVANTFEVIALAEKDKWLPYYYCALTYGLMSMLATDAEIKDLYANKALASINSGLEIKPDESELYVLQAFTCYLMIQVNPMERGMQYMGLANEALAKAEGLNSDNPRIYYLRGQSLYNMPEEFGGGGQAALPILKQAKEKYDKETVSDELYPHWGKEDVDRLLEEISAGGE
jgi:hypothetical protein